MVIKRVLKNNYKLITVAIFLAILGHGFFLFNQILNEQYMISPADQFTQMIIFKDLLYNEFMQGNFFYSFILNGGSNLLSRLSYYYSTSFIFYVTALFTYFLEILNIIPEPTMVYWASLTVFISIFRSILILIFATKYINLFINNQKIALLGASFYAFSSIYFRHVALWEFFADAMIWLPIILFGAEQIIRNKGGVFFTIGIAFTLFNNGYFAFANLLFTLVYIIIRSIISLTEDELRVSTQFKKYLIYSLLGLGLSLPGFIPFVKGFFNTSRLSPEFSIPAFDFLEFNIGHLLLSDSIQILPIIFMVMTFNIVNYKSKNFRFFTVLSWVLILLRFNPFVASLFNGLSYPQFRWHYITFLVMAVVIAVGVKNTLSYFDTNSKKSIISLFISFITVTALYYYGNIQITEHYFDINMLYGLIFVTCFSLLVSSFKVKNIKFVVLPILFLSSLYTIYITNYQLFVEYNLEEINYDKVYNTFDNPNNVYNRAVEYINQDSNRFHRIDFRDLHNLGSQMRFSSFNYYNSFHNHYQQYFYRYHQIINNRESNGTIDGLAGRQVLSSIFQSDYVIADESNQYIVPTGFELIEKIENYGIYKNTIPLAFIHPVNNLYSDDEMDEYYFKEELLIDGAIVEDGLSNVSLSQGPKPQALDYSIKNVGTQYQGNKLIKSESNINIELSLNKIEDDFEDIVIDYTIKPLDDGTRGRYTYSINGHPIQLKSYGDPYSSQLFRHQAHIPFDTEITFNLAPGTDYIFEIHDIYGLSHTELKNRSKNDRELDYDVELDNGNIDISFNNSDGHKLMVLPIFYEKGWSLKINEISVEVLNVNNGMIGFEIPRGHMNIELTYRQPFIIITIIISLLCLFMLFYIEKHFVINELDVYS